MRVVAALGGNALLRRGEPLGVAAQRRNAALAALALAEVARDHELVVTHGNGPQVGLLALQAAALRDVAPSPLDVVGAESEGMVGYLLCQELGNVVAQPVAGVLTQTLVDLDDPAFAVPTKPIGPASSNGRRRLVASPEPLEVVEEPAIRALLHHGVLPICAGGGGVPVARGAEDGRLRGVEAVVDKDLAAALLADRLGADVLLLLTDVDGVYGDWGTPDSHRLERVTPAMLDAERFPAGSMGPKVEAARRFAQAGGRAAIGALEDAGALLRGTSGTQVVPELVVAPR
ncbi:carbamate kinase [Conexibacter sp. SYSU D00693]|uniref:amino acid kinase family protein n=1 Tax=Conexibacter sp. SYSU D00693 TaxID=2812560 RepID=UPI00196AAD46|nr:carbamate kinase [Conexibacter sp. SYSU D00693]